MTDQQPPDRFAAFVRLRRNFRLRGSMRRAADLVALAYIGFIASTATLTGAYYMLFPELSALSWDVMELPRGRWARAPIMLALTPALTGVIGSVVTRRMPYGMISVLLTVAVCVGVIRVMRSPVAPAISAGLLPLVLGVTSWWYSPCILFGTTVLSLLSIPWKHYAAIHADNSDSPLKSGDAPFANSPHTSTATAASDAPAAESWLKSSEFTAKNAEPSVKSAESVVSHPDVDRCTDPPFAESPSAATDPASTESPPVVTPPPTFSLNEATDVVPPSAESSSTAATDAPPASPAHDAAAAIEVPTAAAAFRLLVPLLSFVALAMFAVKLTGMRFILFPPLVVILYEMLSHREHCPWVGRPIAIPVACFASATGGYLFFAHLPFAPLVAMLSMAWGIAVLRTLNLHMPPVLAVALLPLVMTHPTFGYPIAVGFGTMLASAWFEFLARWHWISPLPMSHPLPNDS